MRRAAPLLLALLGACGTLDAPSVEHVVDAPKGPFHESGAFEVCLGHARLVPLDAGGALLGLCVPSSLAPRSCATSAECRGQETCVCGGCELEACVAAHPCSGGRICSGNRCTSSCTIDGECGTGETCANGACAVPCVTGDDCAFGALCDSFDGVCRAELCATDAECGPGRRCALEERAGAPREPAWSVGPSGTAVFLEITTDTDRAIYRAASPSGGRLLVDETPIANGAGLGAPAPFWDGDTLVLFAETASGDIVVLRASDESGISFGAPEMALAAALPWENGRVGSPSVVALAGVPWLFYEAGAPSAIGLAQLDAAFHATTRHDTPVVTAADVDVPTWTGIDHVRAPNALVVDGLVMLYFTARGVERGPATQGDMSLPVAANDSIGLAVTADLTRFDVAPWGPVLARRTNLRTVLGEAESSARLVPGGVEMLFLASDADGAHAGVSLASSP